MILAHLAFRMCDDSAGLGSPSGQLTSALETLCQSVGCNKAVHEIGHGKHQYWAECKVARSFPVPSQQSQKHKHNNSVLSPIDHSIARQSKDDEDDFAFIFNAAFYCEYLVLYRNWLYPNSKAIFSSGKNKLR